MRGMCHVRSQMSCIDIHRSTVARQELPCARRPITAFLLCAVFGSGSPLSWWLVYPADLSTVTGKSRPAHRPVSSQ